MRIRILRDYSGEEGTDVDKNVIAGTEHTVTRARGSQLKANGLAEILSDDDDEEDEADMSEQRDEKQKAPPQNKKAAAPANKAAPEAKTKA